MDTVPGHGPGAHEGPPKAKSCEDIAPAETTATTSTIAPHHHDAPPPPPPPHPLSIESSAAPSSTTGSKTAVVSSSTSTTSLGKSAPLPHKLTDPSLQQIPTEELLGSVTTFSGDAECGHALRTSARVIHKMRMDSIRGTTPPPPEKKEAGGGGGKSGGVGGAAGQAKTPNQQKQVRMVWSNQDKNLFFEALNECGKDFEGIVNYLNTKKRRKDSNSEHALKVKDVRHLYYQFNQKVAKYLHFSDEVKKEAQELYALINYGEMRKKVPFQNKKYFHKLKDLVYKGFTTIREKGRNIRIKTPSCRALRKLNQLEEWQEEIKLPPRIDVVLKPATVDAWGRVQSLAQNPRVKVSVTLQKRLSTLLQLLQQKWRHQDVRLVERINGLKSASTSITSKVSRQKAQHELELCSRMATEGGPDDGESQKILRFTAPKETVIHRPMINLSEFLSSYSICLNSYEQRIGAKVRGEALCLEKLNSFKERVNAGSKRQRHDSGSEKHSPDGKKIKAELKEVKEEKGGGGEVGGTVVTNFNEVFKSPNASNESIDLAKAEFEVGSDGECPSVVGKFNPSSLVTGTGGDTSLDGPDLKSPESNDSLRLTGVSKIKVELESGVTSSTGDNSNDGNVSETEPVGVLAKQEEGTAEDLIKTTVKRKDSKEKCGKRKDSKSGSMTGLSSLHFRPLISEETIQKVREGWTMQNVGDMTVGDLYIMFGEENRLHLEYGWVLPKEVKTEQGESLNGVEKLEGSGGQEVTLVHTNGTENSGGTLNNTIILSGRLKQLLQIANLSEKTGKRRCPCGHVCDRKVKNHDQLNSASISSDNLLFKTPKVPNRNSNIALAGQANCNLVPSPHTAYKQTRWFRMRVNRHQLPSHRVMLGGHYLPGRNSGNNNNFPGAGPPKGTTSNGSASSSGYQSATSSSSNSNETSGSNSPASSIRRPDDDSLTKLLEDKITSFQSGAASKKFRSTTTTKNLTSSGDESSSLSLFDISLPSTSSSLLADIMGSGEAPTAEECGEENSNITTTISTTKILRETPGGGGELVETDINDISLSSFLGHLDAVYESEAAVAAGRRDGDQMNISIISESSVDYIARFEDIAAELRAQQQQLEEQPDSIPEIEVHRS